MPRQCVDFSVLVGKTLKKCFEKDGEIIFETTDGVTYIMNHLQDCCENVYIESIEGSLEDLIGSPILIAEEAIKEVDDWDGSQRWTFYKLATQKGYVDIRWLGRSNGFYSVSVSFKKILA